MEMLLNLCGLVTLQAGDGCEVALRPRGAALLAYLALTPGQKASRRDLAALLWPMRGATQARGSLRQCLSELRAAHPELERLINASQLVVCLDRTKFVTDVEQVEAIEDAAALRQLLTKLCQNSLMGIEIYGDFERWLIDARRSIEIRLRTAIHGKLRQLVAMGKDEEARVIAENWCARAPQDEVALASFARLKPVSPTAGAPTSSPQEGHQIDVQAPPLLIVAAFEARDNRDERTAAALRDDVLLRLGRFQELRLVDDHRPSGQILASTFSCGFLMVASVLLNEGRSVMNCRLVALPEREVLWTGEFDISASQMFDSIASITGQIASQMTLERISHVRKVQAASGELYARYIAAKSASMWPANYTDARASAAVLRLIHTEAPDFAPAYISHARLIATDFGFTRGGPPDPKETEEARALAMAALSLDRGQSNCWTLVGWALLRRGEWEPARAHFEEALRLNPYHASRINEIATGFLFLGEQTRADYLLEQSRSLMISPDHIYWSDRGLFALVRGDIETANDALVCCTQPLVTTTIYTVLAHVLAGRNFVASRAVAEARLRHIWPHGQVPAFSELKAWFDRHHPFRKSAHRERFLEALAIGFG